MTEFLYTRVYSQKVIGAIVLSLRDGMSSFNRLCDSLLSVDTPLVSRGSSVYERIRELIVRAQQGMEKTETEAAGALRKLDEDLESLTAEQQRLHRERGMKKLSLENLNTELRAEIESLNNHEDALKQARRSLQSAEDVLKSQNDRQSTASIVSVLGIGVSFIPYIGWIVGPFMVIGGVVEMEEAEYAISVAEEELERSETWTRYFQRRVSHCRSRISMKKRDIRQMDEELYRVEKKIPEVKQQTRVLTEFQLKMRSALHLLRRLSSTANVLELQTRLFILLEPVMKVMEDVVKLAGEIAGHQILQDEGVMSLVDAMRENKKRLAAVHVSPSSPDLDMFY